MEPETVTVSPTAEMLHELAVLAKGNIYARTCLREFLNTRPCIASLETDGPATARTDQHIMHEEPSERLRACLAACRIVAFDKERNDFGRGQAHEEIPYFAITPEMIKAGKAYMVSQAFNTVSARAVSTEFIHGFCLAILSANRSKSEDFASTCG